MNKGSKIYIAGYRGLAFYRIKTLSRTIKDLSTIQDKEKQKSLMQKGHKACFS